MFSCIKMEEYIEPKLSGIFWVKIVAKNIVLGSTRTHFKHMRFNGKEIFEFKADNKNLNLPQLSLSWKYI